MILFRPFPCTWDCRCTAACLDCASLFLWFLKNYFNCMYVCMHVLCVCVCTHICNMAHVEVRRQLVGVSFFLLPCFYPRDPKQFQRQYVFSAQKNISKSCLKKKNCQVILLAFLSATESQRTRRIGYRARTYK